MVNNYVICTAQRSGKTWLCRILSMLDIIGRPEEFFHYLHANKPNDIKFLIKHKLESEEEFNFLMNSFEKNGVKGTISSLREYFTSPTGVFGFVLQWNQLAFLLQKEAKKLNNKNLLLKHLDKIICQSLSREKVKQKIGNQPKPIYFFLKRNDLIAQAVSHYILSKTGAATYSDRKKNKETIQYDYEKIMYFYNFTVDSYVGWERFFLVNGIEPVRLFYEDACHDLPSFLERMFVALSITPDRIDRKIIAKIEQKFPVKKSEESRIMIEKFNQDLNTRLTVL